MATDPSANRPIPPAGRHGGDGARIAADLGIDPASILDLSASLNPVAPDVDAVIARHLTAGALSRYPDPAGATAALAERLGVSPTQVLLTNGGAEAIALVAAELGGHTVGADFSLYPQTDGGPRWRSDPHSPSGVLAAADEVAGVWDEAFYPLATGCWTAPGRFQHSVIVGSLTKVLSCPGLRVGYVLSDDADLVARLRARQPEWSVNGLVAAALGDLLELVDLPAWQAELARLREELVQLLARHGFLVLAGSAPWVLVPEAPTLRDRLARHGIVVRDCASFALPGTMRVALPDDRNRLRLAAALERLA